jgi:hypothetical protein
VLKKFYGELVTEEYNPVIHDYNEVYPKLVQSNLFKMLMEMPKGALHHLHVTAGPSADTYVKLTYNPCVYFNQREMMFKVDPRCQLEEDGFIQCTEMRKFSRSPEYYDDKLKNFILVQKEEYSKTTASTW